MVETHLSFIRLLFRKKCRSARKSRPRLTVSNVPISVVRFRLGYVRKYFLDTLTNNSMINHSYSFLVHKIWKLEFCFKPQFYEKGEHIGITTKHSLADC